MIIKIKVKQLILIIILLIVLGAKLTFIIIQILTKK